MITLLKEDNTLLLLTLNSAKMIPEEHATNKPAAEYKIVYKAPSKNKSQFSKSKAHFDNEKGFI